MLQMHKNTGTPDSMEQHFRHVLVTYISQAVNIFAFFVFLSPVNLNMIPTATQQ